MVLSNRLKNIVAELKFRKGLTVAQVANSIGYSRVHLQNEMKKVEDSELSDLLIEKHNMTLQNVKSEEANPPPVDYKATYEQSLQLSLAALLEGQALMHEMLKGTREDVKAIRLAVVPDPELLAAYEQSKQTAQKLRDQKKDTRTGKAGKGKVS